LLFLVILFIELVPPQQPFQEIPLSHQVSGSVITALVFGSGLLFLAPEYTTRTTAQIHERPTSTFLYGLGIHISLIIIWAVLVAFFGLLGTLIAASFLFVLLLISQLAYLSLGRAITENRVIMLLIAMGAAAFVVAVPVIGGPIGFFLSCLGLGATYHDIGDTDGSEV
jgi:hypothetical protein